MRDSLKDGFFQLVHKHKRGHDDKFGRKAQVGDFVRDRENAERGERLYTEHIPARLPENKNAKRDEKAIQKFKDHGQALLFDRFPKLKTTAIRIQSPYLRAELRTILQDYNLDFDNEDGVFIIAPFEPLFFARHDIWRRFQQLKKLKEEVPEGEEDEEADDGGDVLESYKHMKLLIDEVLNDDMAEWIEEAENLRQANKITYDLLWTLFPHKSIVVSKSGGGYQQAYQVESYEYVTMADDSRAPVMFDLTCRYVHFDAYRFGYLPKSLTIGHFIGKKDLKDLDIIPLEDASNAAELRQRLIARGKKMPKYQDVQHVQIKPAQLDSSQDNYDEVLRDTRNLDDHGRAIVDFFTGVRRNAKWHRTLQPLSPSPSSCEEDAESEPVINKGKGKADLDRTPPIRRASSPAALARVSNRVATKEELDSRKRPSKANQEENRRILDLDDTYSLLMCPLLHAFSLRSKKWITINVEFVGPVDFHLDALDHLVAEEKYKSCLLSLVKSQLAASDAVISRDPIPEKSRGLLVLLSGPPGTGKTLMAESIAEKAQRPLYYVDARDLGSKTSEIAEHFAVIMENAREWNAVVLLDEADIYLQTRHSGGNIHATDRTTAFLRQLEYFQGILFLTTNLPDTIDSAVESRIHINLKFPALKQAFRVSIWQHFLATVPDDLRSISMADVQRLGAWDVNGRQIKNAFRMCVAYCQQEDKRMNLAILEDMIGMSCPRAVKEALDPAAKENTQLLQESTRAQYDASASRHNDLHEAKRGPDNIQPGLSSSEHGQATFGSLLGSDNTTKHHLKKRPVPPIKSPALRSGPSNVTLSS